MSHRFHHVTQAGNLQRALLGAQAAAWAMMRSRASFKGSGSISFTEASNSTTPRILPEPWFRSTAGSRHILPAIHPPTPQPPSPPHRGSASGLPRAPTMPEALFTKMKSALTAAVSLASAQRKTSSTGLSRMPPPMPMTPDTKPSTAPTSRAGTSRSVFRSPLPPPKDRTACPRRRAGTPPIRVCTGIQRDLCAHVSERHRGHGRRANSFQRNDRPRELREGHRAHEQVHDQGRGRITSCE